jgi:hypothetical protein
MPRTSVHIDNKCGQCGASAGKVKALKDLQALNRIGWRFSGETSPKIHIALYCPICAKGNRYTGDYQGLRLWLRKATKHCRKVTQAAQKIMDSIKEFEGL